MFRPQNRPQTPNWGKKSNLFKSELGENLDHNFKVKFHDEWNGDSLDARKAKTMFSRQKGP